MWVVHDPLGSRHLLWIKGGAERTVKVLCSHQARGFFWVGRKKGTRLWERVTLKSQII